MYGGFKPGDFPYRSERFPRDERRREPPRSKSRDRRDSFGTAAEVRTESGAVRV